MPAMKNSALGLSLLKIAKARRLVATPFFGINRHACTTLHFPSRGGCLSTKGNSPSGIPVRLIRSFSGGQPNWINRSTSDWERANTSGTALKRRRNFAGNSLMSFLWATSAPWKETTQGLSHCSIKGRRCTPVCPK